MEQNNNNTIIVGLLSLILGLLLGYFLSASGAANRVPFMSGMMGMMGGETMEEEMDEMMGHGAGDEFVDGDGAMSHAMDEMMLGFRGLTGEAYEEMFLRGMIVHHLGAIEMAQELLKQTKRPELINLANNIIASQTKEVNDMRAWHEAWFGNN